MEAHLNLGSVLLATGQIADAIRECSAAVSLRPSQTLGHSRLGDALMAAGQFSQAAVQYREALDLAPGNTAAQRGLARLQSLGSPP
jgi:Flp pilus assembly protein TadD